MILKEYFTTYNNISNSKFLKKYLRIFILRTTKKHRITASIANEFLQNKLQQFIIITTQCIKMQIRQFVSD